jgi:hypothetical protein
VIRVSLPELLRLLAEASSRGAIKKLGSRLDQEPELKSAALALLKERGIEAEDGPGKKLVRLLLNRSESAQETRTLTHRDEAFLCCHCGAEVHQGGARVRDHCPLCLWSLHVDRIPGDRKSDCGQPMRPVGLVLDHGEPVIVLECRCGFSRRMRAHPEDNKELLFKLNS